MSKLRKRKFLDHEHEMALQIKANHEFDGNVTRAMNHCVAIGLRCPDTTPNEVAEALSMARWYQASKAASDE
jgi:hypothetical protein